MARLKSIAHFFITALCGALIAIACMHKPTTSASRATPIAHNQTIRHIAFIMDGNRRWAQEQGLDPWLGHRQGVQTVRMVIDFCLEQKIPELSLYVWSLENFKRSITEQDYLFSTLAEELAHTVNTELITRGVKLHIIGDQKRFPEKVRATIAESEEKTELGTKLILNLLFCYGGQQEIVAATKALAHAVQKGTLKAEEISPQLFENTLWSAKTRTPDLIIRTGKRQSLSNFYTYKSAYSEIRFLDCYWPELTREQLLEVIEQFNGIERKYGA